MVTLSAAKGLPTLALLLAVAATAASHRVSAPGPSEQPTPPLSCLLDAATAVEGADSSNATYMGCVEQQFVAVLHAPANISDNSQGAPTLNQTLQCGAQCLLWATNSTNTSGDYNATFAFLNSTCLCIALLDGWDASASGGWRNWGRKCAAARVFNISLPCPLSTVQCGRVTGCSAVGGCCVEDTSSSGLVPSQYLRTMVQWVAIVVIALAVVEGVVYGCVRSRVGRGLEDLEARAARDDVEVRDLTMRLMADISDTNSDLGPLLDDCSICLEGLERRSKVLPCGHRLHKRCLEQYIAHEIRETDNVTCPMCRAALVVRAAGQIDGAPLQVAVHVNAAAV